MNPSQSAGAVAGQLFDPSWLAGRGRLAQSIRLEEHGPSRFVVAAIGGIAALLLALLIWAGFTQVGEISSASGEVTPLGAVKKVQHLEGGIVSAIHVREGDVVEAGQLLIELAGGVSGPDLQQQRARLAALQLQESQLRSMARGKESRLTVKDEKFRSLAANQEALLRDKRRELASQETVLRRQADEYRASAEFAAVQTQGVRAQIAILEEQIRSRQPLVDEGYVARTLLLDQQRELARTQTQLAELLGQVQRSREAMGGVEARIQELHARASLDSTLEISKVHAEIVELRETIQRAGDRVERLALRAPVRGIVKGPLVETVGGVIAPGATVLEVIPLDAPLIVEARVPAKDIGFVHAGQPARVKVATYDYTRFGSIDGRIETASATTFADDKGNPFYRVRIRLAKNHVGADPMQHLIIPGMTVLADIQTGEKSVLAYLLRPILRGGEAFHEK